MVHTYLRCADLHVFSAGALSNQYANYLVFDNAAKRSVHCLSIEARECRNEYVDEIARPARSKDDTRGTLSDSRCNAGRGTEHNGFAEERFREPARGRPPARLVALDERQHHQGGHQARSRVDASSRPGRLSELRCVALHATGGRKAIGIHDAGLERRIQVRYDVSRSAWIGRSDCRIAWMERNRRSVGAR